MKIQMSDDVYELYTTGKNKTYKDIARNPVLMEGFYPVIHYMKAADTVEDLKRFSVLHYEQLRYHLSGYSSVRLSNSYVHRLLFSESEDGLKVELLKIDKTHYGNKH